MSQPLPRDISPGLWRALAWSLAATTVAVASVAWAHAVQVAQMGVICGTSSGPGHCWACYAAPVLGLATAFSAWKALSAPARARVRVR